MPSAISCSLSPLISRIHSFLFWDWRCSVSPKFFDTQIPSISIEGLVLPRQARCVLSRLRYNGHSLLLSSYLTISGRIENPLCNACKYPSQETSRYTLHCPAADSLRHSLFGNSLSLYNLWSWPWRVFRLLGVYGLWPCIHPSEGGLDDNNNNNVVEVSFCHIVLFDFAFCIICFKVFTFISTEFLLFFGKQFFIQEFLNELTTSFSHTIKNLFFSISFVYHHQ